MTTGGLFGRDSGQFFMPSRNGKKRKKLSMLPDMVDDPTGGVYQPLDPSGRKRMLGAEWSRLDKQAIPSDLRLPAHGNLMEIIPLPPSTERRLPGARSALSPKIGYTSMDDPTGEAYQPMTPPDAVGDPTGGMYQPNTMEQEIAAWEAAQGIPQGRGGGQGNVLGAPYPLDPDAVGARQPQPLNADLEASLQRRMQRQAVDITPDDPTGGVYQPIAYPSPVDDPTGGVYQPSYPSPVDDPTGGIYQPIPTVGDPRGGSAVTGFPSNPNVLPNISPRHQTPLYPAGMSPNEAIGGNWQDVVSAGPGAPGGSGPTIGGGRGSRDRARWPASTNSAQPPSPCFR